MQSRGAGEGGRQRSERGGGAPAGWGPWSCAPSPGSHRYRQGSTRPRGGRGRCRRWHSPRASRPLSPAGRERREGWALARVWGGGGSPQRSPHLPHQADAAEAGVQEGREGLVVVEDLSHVGTSCREESRLAALETPRLAGCWGQPHPVPPSAPLVPVTCRAVGAALPGDVDGVGARLHAVRPLAAHRAISLRGGGEARGRDLGPVLAGLNPKLTGLNPKSKGQKPTELGSCQGPWPRAAWCPEGRAGCPGSPAGGEAEAAHWRQEAAGEGLGFGV